MSFSCPATTFFGPGFSQWSWRSLIQLDWLASNSQGSSCPHSPGSMFTGVCRHTSLLSVDAGAQTRVLMFAQLILYPLTPLPSSLPGCLWVISADLIKLSLRAKLFCWHFSICPRKVGLIFRTGIQANSIPFSNPQALQYDIKCCFNI